MPRELVSTKFRAIKYGVASLLATGMLVTSAVPAFAQPVVTGGLVNVTITNVLNQNQVTVTIPIQAAANVCGVDIGVLTTAIGKNQTVTCTSNPSQGTSVTVSPP
jgi:hypothetical protein